MMKKQKWLTGMLERVGSVDMNCSDMNMVQTERRTVVVSKVVMEVVEVITCGYQH